MSRKLGPDFLVIGAAKSATTSLYRAVERFDDFFMTHPKEPAFFSNPDQLKLGMDWYRGLFADAPKHAMRGEASTTYSRFPYDTRPNTIDPWPGIAREFPEVKLIYLVRNPIDRAYSHYRHWMRSRSYVDFSKAIDRQPPILDCSRYRSQIEHVEKHMGRGRIFVETFERFSEDPAIVIAGLRSFLGLQPRILPDETLVENRHNSRRVVSDQLARLPGASGVKKWVPKRIRRGVVDGLAKTAGRHLFRKQIQPEPLETALRQKLAEEFADDTAFIEALLGRTLETWRA